MVRPVQNDRAYPRGGAKESAGRFRVMKINIDEEPAFMQRFGIRGVPALLFFSGGQSRDQILGVAAKKAIVDKLAALAGTVST